MNEIPIQASLIDSWVDGGSGPVALYIQQELCPVEEKSRVIFPPTYADIGYNIDVLSDGTNLALIDSVGSQANRMEPIFKKSPYSSLVPQIEIEINSKSDDGETFLEKRSIMDLAHRAADAVVYSSPGLTEIVDKAFAALRRKGDAGPLCKIAPTSLVFGVWDSRGGSGEKRPRLIRSVIRAWDVELLHTAAQFNSIWKYLDEQQKEALKKESASKKTDLSEKGLADAPAIFRKIGTAGSKGIPQYLNGHANPARRVLGGVIARGQILREITINLVALRAIQGKDPQETEKIRKYLLGLSLVSATADIDLYLREGCNLRFTKEHDVWKIIPRRGDPEEIKLNSEHAQRKILDYANNAADHFRTAWPADDKLQYRFDLKAAKKLLAKKTDTESGE